MWFVQPVIQNIVWFDGFKTLDIAFVAEFEAALLSGKMEVLIYLVVWQQTL